MSNTIFRAGWVKLPVSAFSTSQIETFTKALSYVSPFTSEDGTKKTINLYNLTEKYLYVPVEWIKANYPSLYSMTTDATVATGKLVYSKLPDSNHPSVRDPAAQEAFTQAVRAGLEAHNRVLAYAPTGTGKTVVALKVAAQLGYRTLVLVNSEFLKNQWIKEIQDKLGIDREKIGEIQQDKCEIEGKSIVVGMLQTLARREYSEEVFNSFGLVIIDECHNLSTEFFAEVVPKFNARYMLGLSATIKRKDGSDIVLYYHLGSVRVEATAKPLPIKVMVKNYYSKRKLWGQDERQRMMCLSKDPDRNDLIISYVKQLYEAGRNILVTSHTIVHVEHLMMLMKKAGIPTNDIGQFTSERQNFDLTGKLVGRKKISQAELETNKNKRVVVATTNMFKEAVDVPQLDAGLDALPDWKATQLLGRIRRPYPNKLYPKWITIKDVKCTFSMERYYSRLSEYNECEAQVINI